MFDRKKCRTSRKIRKMTNFITVEHIYEYGIYAREGTFIFQGFFLCFFFFVSHEHPISVVVTNPNETKTKSGY